MVILIWGITFANTRALLGDFSALEILVVRFALAWAVLVVVFFRTRGEDSASTFLRGRVAADDVSRFGGKVSGGHVCHLAVGKGYCDMV